jgi:hypothetical protein
VGPGTRRDAYLAGVKPSQYARNVTTPNPKDVFDAIVVVGIDRLGRNASEVMTTIRDLGERGIVLRSLREGIDTANASGRMVAGVLASLAELDRMGRLGPRHM